MKPPGLAFRATADGAVVLAVTHSNRAMDAIWDAVEEAITAGMTPDQFRSEAADAWRETLRVVGEDAFKALGAPERKP